MRSTPGNGANELPEWPSVLKIANDEVQQCVAVAQLAVKLWENKIARVQGPLEKDKVRDEGPQKFLEEAWELIQSAREHVLRAQTDAEYLAAHPGTHEAAENVAGRILSESRVQFQKLCNDKETYPEIELHDVETNTIIKIEWNVYRSEAGFKKLFWRYWNATSVIKDEVKRKEYGEALLASWKKDGVLANTFLALVRFRREHDKRAANLKKSPKGKRRRLTAKTRP
jgi:hypothetical protein